MCGVVGALVFKDSPFRVTDPYITRMRGTIVNRGPDGSGIWIEDHGKVGLGYSVKPR